MIAIESLQPMLLLVTATGEVKDSDVSPGVLGFAVVALLGVATWLLVRSMTRRIKKIRLPDDEDEGEPGEATEGEPRASGDD